MKAATSSVLAAAMAVALSATAHAFAPISSPIGRPSASSSSSSSSSLSMSLRPTYDSLSQKVSSSLGLQSTDFTDSIGARSWNGGTAEWLSESSPKFLTGVTFATLGDGEFLINVWMGPSYDVPHMLLTFGSQGDSYKVEADFIPRGPTPIGSDPQMLESYFGDNQRWLQAFSNPGSVPLGPSPAFDSRLLVSPAKIAVGGLTAEAAAGIAEAHIDTMLGWIQQAQPVPARSRGSFNLRDDKLRQFYFKGKLVEAQLLGTSGDISPETMAAAQTGPIAEAYVGGGS